MRSRPSGRGAALASAARPSGGQGGRSFARRWMLATTLLFAMTLAWGLASPAPSGPDEPAHLVKAAAIVRGTVIGSPDPGGRSAGTVLVHVPVTFQSLTQQAFRCDYGKVDRPAECPTALYGSWHMVPMSTYEGRYPPLYYLLTGLPTLVTERPALVVYLMRAVGGLIVAGLLGLAFAAVATWGRTRLAVLAVAVAVTPTTLYLGGVVNPSGMEVAAAVALWTTAALLVFVEHDDPPPALVAAAAASACVLAASRALSPGFMALVVAAVVVLRPAGARRLWQHRRVRVATTVSFGVAFVSGLYVLAARSYLVEGFPVAHRSPLGNVLLILGRTPRYVRQAVGAFGSPNFAVPGPVITLWVVAAVGLLATGLLLASRRDALVLGAVVAVLGLALPFAVIYSHVNTDGPIWQGRYSLPLIAGLPLVAALLVEERLALDVDRLLALRATRRAVTGTTVLLAAGWLAAWYWVLRRYTVGLAATATDAFAHVPGGWSPTVPAPVLFTVVAAATVAWVGWLLAAGAALPGVPPRHRAQPAGERVEPVAAGVS